MNRRQALKATLAAPTISAASNVGTATKIGLQEKFFGCIAGVHIGSAMGAPVEGWTWQRIQDKYGTVERLLPYEHYGNGWTREPGTTEDGVERQKLMTTAIIEKRDRVTAEDVRVIWIRDIKPESAGMVSEPFEATLLAMAKAGIPATDIGRYCDYAGLVSMARSCHPLGLINAGNPEGAIADVLEVGQLYQTANSRGLKWAAVTAAATASATKLGATVESVLDDVRRLCDRGAVGEIERGLKHTAHCRNFHEMREAFDSVYSGRGMAYAFSFANEVVTKGICVFRMTRGNTRDAMIAGVNFGRDTDCLTAVAAGISGALSGAGSLPEQWLNQVDYATSLNKYTNSQRTLRQHSDGLYKAFRARLRKMRDYVDLMESV